MNTLTSTMYTPEKLAELRLRWQALQTAMTHEGADAMLISNNVNLFYTSGRVFNGYVYLPVEGDPLFFVRRPVGLTDKRVIYIHKVEEISEQLTKLGLRAPQTLLLECDSISYRDYQRYESVLKPREIRNATPLIRRVRSIKTPYEVEQIRRSGALHGATYALIPSLYRKGMTELELSIEIERQMRLHGSLGLFRIFGDSMEIFMGSVIAGDNADTPSPYDFALGGAGLNDSLPVGGNGTRLAPGMSIMVDLGGNFTGYMSDMSRVFSVGQLSELAYRAHEVSLDIQRCVEAVARPGTEAAALYNLALEMAAEAGLGEYFMGHTQKAGFVGHGLGIEINEGPVLAPRSREVLSEGMVFALEPKFVIPGVGAVGIENTFVVTPTGIEKLTPCEEQILELQG